MDLRIDSTDNTRVASSRTRGLRTASGDRRKIGRPGNEAIAISVALERSALGKSADLGAGCSQLGEISVLVLPTVYHRCPHNSLAPRQSTFPDPNLINPRRACEARVTVVGLCVRPSVRLSTTILALQATRRLMSDTNSFSATRA